MPQPASIFIMRHAEKPTTTARGVTAAGRKSPRSLIVKGWQRAGALGIFLAPLDGPLNSTTLATPGFLFASSSRMSKNKPDKSHRERETITPLAHRLNVEINLEFDINQEPAAIAAALQCEKPVLLCWDHHLIATLARQIPGAHHIPDKWPAKRFDLIYAFHLEENGHTYTFAQVPLPLLGGDLKTVLGK